MQHSHTHATSTHTIKVIEKVFLKRNKILLRDSRKNFSPGRGTGGTFSGTVGVPSKGHRHTGASTPGALNGTVKNLAPLAAVAPRTEGPSHWEPSTPLSHSFHVRQLQLRGPEPRPLSPELLHLEKGPAVTRDFVLLLKGSFLYVSEAESRPHSVLSSNCSRESTHPTQSGPQGGSCFLTWTS